MLILAFDTTSELGGAAIYQHTHCLASVTNGGPANYYSVTLFEMVEGLLRKAKLALHDMDLFAVATGPGSFTGIRVGVAAAQGWASAFDRPVKGISVLEALVEEAQPETERAVTILDAYRGEFFAGLFRRFPEGTNSRYRADGQGLVLKPDMLVEFLSETGTSEGSEGSTACVVREHDRAALALGKKLPDSFRWQLVSGPLVGAIARLALQAYQAGQLQSPADLDACYVRRADAELLFPRLQSQRQKA